MPYDDIENLLNLDRMGITMLQLFVYFLCVNQKCCLFQRCKGHRVVAGRW